MIQHRWGGIEGVREARRAALPGWIKGVQG